MRRRRFPRRPGLRPRPGRRRPIPPKLIKAHQLFDGGEFAQAAELYLELGEKAQLRGIPQAPNLYLRAAAALVRAGNSASAANLIRKGLGILAGQEKWHQLARLGGISVQRLEREGQEEMATELQAWLEEQTGESLDGQEFRLGLGCNQCNQT